MKITIHTPAFVGWDKKGNGKITLQPVGLYDRLVFTRLNDEKIRIIKTGVFKIPTNDQNPVYRAAMELRKLKPGKYGASITIHKNIPSFSGLNSQHANAAGALIALNQLWEVNLSDSELKRLAEKIHPIIGRLLDIYLKPLKSESHPVVLVAPTHITIDREWMDGETSRGKNRSFEAVAFRHFPDLEKMVGLLRSEGACASGLSKKGPVVFGWFKKPISKTAVKKVIGKKAAFLWFGGTCNGAITSDTVGA